MFRSRNVVSSRLPPLVLLASLALSACGGEKSAVVADDNSVVAAAEAVTVASPWRSDYSGIGRAATDAEVAAWDIDVRPDFAGLPAGAGSVEDGEALWLDRCASCHGDFADSNKFFSPLALGNVTETDMETGHVASLNDPTRVRTTLMKVATVSTLWDYINRAMPWNAPKTLSSDEVYSLVAYLLSLGYIVDYDFTLSNENIADVQALMPNRNGMTLEHGLWKVDGQPDVSNSACMSNCENEVTVESFIPDFARNAHGNLIQQMRIFGPHQGIDTSVPRGEATQTEALQEPEAADADDGVMLLLSENACLGCHQMDGRLVGPSFKEVGAKYANQSGSVAYLVRKIREGGSGVWGGAMPPMPQLTAAQAEDIANWLIAQ